jgi:hypothetical protein
LRTEKIEGGKIMFGFDKMFDFNGNGQLDSWERAAQFQFMDEMSKNDERREVLEDAGLDPDEFDF